MAFRGFCIWTLHTVKCNLFLWSKLNLSSLLQSSESHDPSQITLIWGSDDQQTFARARPHSPSQATPLHTKPLPFPVASAYYKSSLMIWGFRNQTPSRWHVHSWCVWRWEFAQALTLPESLLSAELWLYCSRMACWHTFLVSCLETVQSQLFLDAQTGSDPLHVCV